MVAVQPDEPPEALDGTVGRKKCPGIHAYQKPSMEVVAVGASLIIKV